MSKATGSKREKSRRSKRARDVAVRDAAPTAAAGRQPAPVVSPPAPGQRLYDMPYSSPAPRLVNPELGLEHLVARAGHNAGYEIDLTLLDAPDHRLMRSGVLLAHRVLEGRGEWYLGAPDWVPLLPKELIESMNQAELSEDMADLIRPFRRRAPLTPVAALRCERREFALRAAQGGATVALLRDDKVTVRRGGLTTARYREVMLTPVGPGLNQDQAEWLDQCLTGAGATVLRVLPAVGSTARSAGHRPHRLPGAPAVRSAGPVQHVRVLAAGPAAAPTAGRRPPAARWRPGGGRRPGRGRRLPYAGNWTACVRSWTRSGRPICSTNSTGLRPI